MDGTKERPLAPTKALILLERPAQKHWHALEEVGKQYWHKNMLKV